MPPVRDLFERIEVSCGGVILSQGANFANVMARARDALLGDSFDPVTGHAKIIRRKADYGQYTNLTNGENELAGQTVPTGETLFAFHAYEMEGFMSSVDPKLFDSSIIPDLRVRLYMAPNSVLSASKFAETPGLQTDHFADQTETAQDDVSLAATIGTGPGRSNQYKVTVADAKYEITNIVGTIECISLADMTYENLLASTMQAQGYLEAPFKAYHSFQDTHSGATRFSVATQSLDRVWITWRGTDFSHIDTPIMLQTGVSAPGLVVNREDATAGALMPGDPEPDYKPRYMYFTEPRKYFTSKDAAGKILGISDQGNWKLQLQLNGAYFPQYMANLQQLYEISTNSTEGRRKNEMSQMVYRHGNCVQCFRLNMPDSELSHTLSGLDTRAVNLAGYVKTVGTNTSTCNVFVECTSTLRIGAGRAIELIV